MLYPFCIRARSRMLQYPYSMEKKLVGGRSSTGTAVRRCAEFLAGTR